MGVFRARVGGPMGRWLASLVPGYRPAPVRRPWLDLALAALYHRSGWTQDELAKVEGCDRKTIARNTLFGRFLSFGPSGPIPRNLTERRFRSYWARTDKANGNERQRFAEVLRMLRRVLQDGRKASSMLGAFRV